MKLKISFEFPLKLSCFLCMPCDVVVELWTFESNNVVALGIRFLLFSRDYSFLFLFLIVAGFLCAEDQPEM